MKKEQIAVCTKQGRYDEIIQFAEKTDIDSIENSGILMHIGNAYEKMTRLEEAVSVFHICLKKYEDEEAANRIVYIAKIQKNESLLQELIQELEENAVADEALLLAYFEILRVRGEALEDQIEALEEYIQEYPDEKYFILLLELILQSGDEKYFSKRLLTYQRDYGCGKYSSYVEEIKKAAGSHCMIEKENSIQKCIYPEFKKAATSAQNTIAIKKDVPKKKVQPISIKKKMQEDKKRMLTPADIAKLLLAEKGKRKKYKSYEPATIGERFKHVAGMKSVRNDMTNIYDSLRVQQDKVSSGFTAPILDTTIFTVSGMRGSGKTMVAVKIAELLYDYGIRASEEPLSVDAKDFLEMVDNLKGLEDVTLIIEDLDRCLDDKGNLPNELVEAIYKYFAQMQENISIIVTGNRDSVRKLCEMDIRIEKLIEKKMSIEPYTLDELMEIFEILVAEKDFVLEDEAKALVRRQLKNAQYMTTFANAYTIEERIKRAKEQFIRRYTSEDEDTDEAKVLLKEEDFMMEKLDGSVTEELEKLNKMTGLTRVKEIVSTTIAQEINAQKVEARNEDINLRAADGLHMIFKGAPGTGKTTVARIIGRIYIAAGILPGNEEGFVEVSAADLVSQYVGETQQKTKAVLDRAMGGILFVDEAYSLLKNQHGQEAIDEIIAVMENCRDSIMLIFAGYDEDMEKFLDANQGMRSRISTEVYFEDYTEEELLEIFHSYLKQANLELADDTEDIVKELIQYRSKGADFGNARGVRKIINDIKQAVGKRHLFKELDGKQADTEDYKLILREDITNILNEDSKNKKNLEELIADIDEMPGLEDLKKMIHGYEAKVKAVERRKEMGLGQKAGLHIENLHMIFAGSAGTGKTTAGRKVGNIFKGLGILPRGDKMIECSGVDLCGDVVGAADKLVKEKVKHAMGGILFIDEAYGMQDNAYGKEAINALIKEMEDKRGKFMVIMAGYAHDMDKLMQTNEGLRSRFKTTVMFEDFSIEQLCGVFENFVKKDEYGYQIEDEAYPLIRQLLEKESKTKDFGNARGVRNIWDNVKDVIDERVANATDETDPLDFNRIKPEDIKKLLEDENDNLDSVETILAEIESMTGLESVKRKIRELVDQAKYRSIAKQKGWKDQDFGTQHMLFLGNAGTGKTSIARKLGQIYYQLGVTRTSKVVECGAQDLIAGYKGQTAQKTQDVIDRALGGILFVDEAYNLIPKDQDSDFEAKAVVTILTNMENHRDDLIVIFAGYEKEIDDLIASNQGFESRFSSENRIYFEDYTTEEMSEIFISMMRAEDIVVSEELLPDIIELIRQRKEKANDFGNARGVRNLVQSVKSARKGRIVKLYENGIDEMMQTLEREDILMVLNNN